MVSFVSIVLVFAAYDVVVAREEDKTVDGYVQVTDGCKIVLSGCLNVRSGPGTGFKKVQVLRIGAMVQVDKEVKGEDGRLWYRIKQDAPLRFPGRAKGSWFIAADYVKWVQVPEEPKVSTLTDVGKRIVIDLSEQKLYAYEGDKLIMETFVSTGLKGTPTPKGEFKILSKKPSRYMQGPLPGMTDYYDLPGVPWTMYFTWTGAAIHGAYWHDDFGHRHSHGCVNLPIDQSELIYIWARVGTKVSVIS